jgi:phenylacetate-CoA ligase
MGPGVAIECIEAKQGLHIWEDHFLPEIIDPDSGEVLPEGSRGELVITTITKEGIPLLRYRTRDITSLTREPCVCGRTHARLARMSGRSDDMLIIRGVNVFPSQIESILMRMEGVEPHYLLVVDRVDNLDTLEVQVEVGEQLFSDEIKVLQGLAHCIEKEIKDLLGVTCKVRLVEPKTIARSEGKARRVIDNRKS